MRRSNRSSSSLVRNLIAIGATYVGVRAVSSAFTSLSTTLVGLNSEVENTTLAIASLYAEIEGTRTFGDATRAAQGLYRQMELLAVSSPGTASNIADAFSMAMGPMRNAGVEMENLLTFSRDAVAVASALRIDMPQVARDISMMATGVAGTDVRTFRMLRSMGMISETTEEWNQMALARPAEAAQRMISIFQRLGEQSAEAFGQTWTGVTSAFEDIMGFFARAFSGSAFRVLTTELSRVNSFLLRYRSGIEAVLRGFGTRLEFALSRTANRINIVFYQVLNNIDSVAARIDRVIQTFQRIGPIIRRMAIVGIALKLGAVALGTAFTVGGAVLSALTTTAGALLPLLTGLAGGGGLAGLLGLGGAGAAAAAGGTAATGGIGALVAIGAPLAMLVPLLMALPGIIAGVTAGAAAVAGVFIAVWRNMEYFGNLVSDIGPMLWETAENFWRALVGIYEAVSPILETVGFIIAGVVITAFRALVQIILVLSRVFSSLVAAASILFGIIAPLGASIRAAFAQLFVSLRLLAAGIMRLLALIPGASGTSIPTLNQTGAGGGVQGFVGDLRAQFRGAMANIQAQQLVSEMQGTGRAPGARPTTNVDMRGSRIEVRQEFREADPDRVWMQMRDALEREAVQRTTSGFVPALTR